MTKNEILENLCYYDKRNPGYNADIDDIDNTQEHDCFCDNCFYGKTKLANFILDRLKSIETEYGQYHFFLEGYRNGSASISEVNAAHNEFLKSIKLE